MSKRHPAFDRWWDELARKGDPMRVPNLAEQAFAAGMQAGRREAEREQREEIRGAAAEATWRERQGEDYGSY